MNAFLSKYADLAVAMAIQYVPQVLLAFLTLWIGFKLVRVGLRGLEKIFRFRKVDPAVAGFLESVASILLRILLLLSVAAMLGVQTTSFIAVIGAATLAVGMSLQGSLANFAGGILILSFKPFKVGDKIEAQTHSGTVRRIEMFSTILENAEGNAIIMPNGPLSNTVIINHSRQMPEREKERKPAQRTKAS